MERQESIEREGNDRAEYIRWREGQERRGIGAEDEGEQEDHGYAERSQD